nr:MAG TPA_asm: hypothetical protein [Caudoviricetes sp.]
MSRNCSCAAYILLVSTKCSYVVLAMISLLIVNNEITNCGNFDDNAIVRVVLLHTAERNVFAIYPQNISFQPHEPFSAAIEISGMIIQVDFEVKTIVLFCKVFLQNRSDFFRTHVFGISNDFDVVIMKHFLSPYFVISSAFALSSASSAS